MKATLESGVTTGSPARYAESPWQQFPGASPAPGSIALARMIQTPSNIRAHQADQILELVWSDGREDRLAYRYLRGECPCALCKDEWSGERILDPATIRADIKLEGMDPVGNYAVRLIWNDGHSSGLFTWEALRGLADQTAS